MLVRFISVAVFAMIGTLPAQASPRNLDWHRQTLPEGSGDHVWTLGGTSLDAFYMGLRDRTSILKYDADTNSWAAFASWDDHFDGNANWNSTETPLVAANGDHLWVSSAQATGGGYVAYYDGTNWTDIATSTTTHYGIGIDPADGTKAGFAIGSNNLRIVNSDGTQVSTTHWLNTMQSISGSGDNWFAKGGMNTHYLGRTTDGGVNWENTAVYGDSGGFARVQGVHAFDENRIAVAHGGDVFLSTTAGGDYGDGSLNTTDWTKTTPGGGTVRGVYVEEWTDDTISLWAFGFGTTSVGLKHYDGTDWATIDLPSLPAGSNYNMSTFIKIGDHYWLGGYDSFESEGALLFTTIPEPSTIMLLGSAAGLWFLRRRRIKPGHQVL